MLAALVLAATLVFGAGDALDDLLKEIKATKDDVMSMVQSNVAYGAFAIPPACREIPKAERAAAVETAARFVRSYVESDAFKKWYDEFREGKKPERPEPPKGAAQQRSEQLAEANAGIAELEAQRDASPPEMRAAMDEAVKTARSMLAQSASGDPTQEAEADRAAQEEYAARLREHEAALAAWDKEFPAHNPKPLLARRIKEFLEATEGIDFDAPLVSNGELKLFKNPDYEAKPKAWKMGYRAGKQATEKARELARDWLKTLE